MAWMIGKDGKMVVVEPGTPVYGEIPSPLAMNIVNPQDGQALVYDGTKGEWVNGAGGGGGGGGGSFDPTITDPQDGQAVVYDATAGKWKNGAVDVGWKAEYTQLLSETVTTVSSAYGNTAVLSYSEFINADKIKVKFDGIDYICNNLTPDASVAYYGGIENEAPDFSEYPFVLQSSNSGTNGIATQTAGEHSIVISEYVVDTSEEFNDAVAKANPGMPFLCQSGLTTKDEMLHAMQEKRLLYFYDAPTTYIITTIVDGDENPIYIMPTGTGINVGFDENDIFIVYVL